MLEAACAAMGYMYPTCLRGYLDPVPRMNIVPRCVCLMSVCLFVCVSRTHSDSDHDAQKRGRAPQFEAPFENIVSKVGGARVLQIWSAGLQEFRVSRPGRCACGQGCKHAPPIKQARLCLEHGICPTPSSLRLLRQLHLRRISLKPIRPKRPWTAHTWPM